MLLKGVLIAAFGVLTLRRDEKSIDGLQEITRLIRLVLVVITLILSDFPRTVLSPPGRIGSSI